MKYIAARACRGPEIEPVAPVTTGLMVEFKMSALGHEQTSRHVRVMSVIPLKPDIHQRGLHVRLVPQADTGKNIPAAHGAS